MRARRLPFYVNTLLLQAVTFVLRPTAIYRAIELDVPPQWLGAMGASFAVVPLVMAIPVGHASDRFGEKRVMLLGAMVVLAASACFAGLANGVAGLLAATVLLGVGHLCSVVGQQALVANSSPTSGYDTAFGRYTFVASAGQAVGPALIILAGGSSPIPDTEAIFWPAVAVSVVLVGVTLLIPSSSRQGRSAADAPGSVRDLLRRPSLVRALTVSCVVLAAVDISLVYLPLLGAERGIPAGVIGVLLGVRAAASMISRLFLGRLASWLGRGRLLTLSVAVSAAGMALLPVPMPVGLLVGLVAVMGLGLGAGQPLTMSWLAQATPPGLKGRAMSLRLTGNRLGQVVVPSVAGALAAGAGAAGVLWVTAGALAAVGLGSRGIMPPTAHRA